MLRVLFQLISVLIIPTTPASVHSRMTFSVRSTFIPLSLFKNRNHPSFLELLTPLCCICPEIHHWLHSTQYRYSWYYLFIIYSSYLSQLEYKLHNSRDMLSLLLLLLLLLGGAVGSSFAHWIQSFFNHSPIHIGPTHQFLAQILALEFSFTHGFSPESTFFLAARFTLSLAWVLKNHVPI